MAHLIDKDALVAWAKETYLCENASMIRKVCYKQLLEHLDTLEVKEVEEEPVSEDLEEAAKERVDAEDYCCVDEDGMPLYDSDYLEYMFKEGANWQKQQDERTIIDVQSVAYANGMAAMKQQMIKDAVEVPIEEAVPFGSCKWKLCAKLWLDKGVKGNKVKLIIIRED